jgi:RHS repeat-associated protein
MAFEPDSGRQAPAAKADGDGAAFRPPTITLPKGGGAIHGIGEKFAANPVNGTSSITVPLAASPGRSGFAPQLSLSYDSGSGNGSFGLGWSLALSSITRKTDKQLPQYHDAAESDVFIISDAEDLVPAAGPDDLTTVPGSAIRRYRPRVESSFARIERWTEIATGEIHWRSITRENVTTLYGADNNSWVFDPADPDLAHPTRIFSWLVCQSYDDKGNAVLYEYQSEDSERIFEDLHAQPQVLARERNRTAAARSANRYLKRVKYGNRVPNRNAITWQPTDAALLPADTWMFEVVFDYGEGHYTEYPPDAAERIYAQAQLDPPAGAHWPVRQDPFSSYRAGFEVRTYRLCRRALMFHHFPQELGIDDCLVRATEFAYAENPVASVLTGVTQSGYLRQPSDTQPNRYLKDSLPVLEFEYSQAPSPELLGQQPVREVDPLSLENLPVGLDGSSYQWVDLDGEGSSGIFSEQADGWFYKRNLSANNLVEVNGAERALARFGPVEAVARKPVVGVAQNGQFLDLTGDGQIDVVHMEDPVRGFYERTDDAGWTPFQPFASWPVLDTHDPNLRFVDLSGDGYPDILITECDVLRWYPSLAEKGFGPALAVSLPVDEEEGPRLVFADGEQSIFLADCSGDGLTDLVRIRNGEVCYWPNLGFGRFGPKVTMDNAPWFDTADQFDEKRIRLIDTDGSGTIDILYLRGDGVQVYFNQSGNSWSAPASLPQFPGVDGVSSVQAVDLLGTGTACLVWSSPLPGAARLPMRYVSLMDEKPHLMVKVKNNLGSETVVHYSPSTRFYLDDKRDGKPWVTRLPFPVHVVDRIDTFDRVSRSLFVTRYAYHHGYFDGVEREFRGFGMIEQLDTEEFEVLDAGGIPPEADNFDAVSHVPPLLTKTWYHTGVFQDRDHISDYFAGLLDANDQGEYYREPGLTDAQARALLLQDTVLPPGLTAGEEREACRALKGFVLRQELYALDGTAKAQHPYTVVEQNFTIEMLQNQGTNRHAVFFTHPREAITYHYERDPADPRIQHALTLEVDDFGSVLKSASVAYPRRVAAPDLSPDDQRKQSCAWTTYTESDVTNGIDIADDYRAPMPAETRTYELTGYTPTGTAGRYQPSDFVRPDPVDPSRLIAVFDSEIEYEQQSGTGAQRRIVERIRTLYRKDDLTALLPSAMLEARAFTGETYKLAFSPGLLSEVFQRGGNPLLPVPADVLGGPGPGLGGYVDLDGNGRWWIPSGRVFLSPGAGDSADIELAYARQHFALPHRYRDPFHTAVIPTEKFVLYDAYDLLLLETLDPLGNRVTAGQRRPDGTREPGIPGHDYRVLQPRLLTDPNRNRSMVAFDVLGMVVATAVMGKPEETLGDSLDGLDPNLTTAIVLDHLAHPLADPEAILGRATTRLVYDLRAYQRTESLADPQPSVVYTLARETHDADLQPGQPTRIRHTFSYSDGFGREIQKKVEAEAGPAPARDGSGRIIIGADGRPQLTAGDVSPRWVGSGWTAFNNKGKPVRQYEPFFTDIHRFEFDLKIGITRVLFYDPVERAVVTLHPNHTWEKVVFDPWRQETWDVNDTVLVADPRTDADAGPFFSRLADAEYLPSWYSQRSGGALGPAEQDAAAKTSVHAVSPAIAHADALGRTFLTVSHDKFQYTGSAPGEEFHTARTVYDVEGNQREISDAIGRTVMRYDFDMLGNRLHQASMEAGERWILNDAAGKSLCTWDSLGRQIRNEYDPLRRLTKTLLSTGANPPQLVGRTSYGEAEANAEDANLRGKPYQVFDQSGVATTDEYDFKGGLLRSRRQLAQNYRDTLDWLGPVPLETETYLSRTTYDALNRAVQIVVPHSDQPGAEINVIEPVYNEANLLDQVHVWLGQPAEPAAYLDPASALLHAVTNIDYDAKGQRTRIEYGNGVRTTYTYDPLTFRLVGLLTQRDAVAFPGDCPQPPPAGWPGCSIQNLSYSYDPLGNVTSIHDAAQQSIFFRNKRVEPSNAYLYDSLYRLIEASGREHLGQVGGTPIPHSYNDSPRVGIDWSNNDGHAMGTYLERYFYDPAGNFLEMQHRGNDPANPGWNRTYSYNEASQLEPAKQNNRLTSTEVAGITETYSTAGNGYDAHGNMLRMPQLQAIDWDYRDQLHMSRRQAVNGDDVDGLRHAGERTYYVYDSGGQRARKVTETSAGAVKNEYIYLGGFEIYRASGTMPLVRETLHILDGTRRIATVERGTEGEDGSPSQLVRFQLTNHLGSASLELDDQAQIISYEEYTPFGGTSYQAVRSQTETPKRFRYTGVERDEESGLNYHRARYCAPWLGRWVSADPAGLVDGGNLYRYVRDNPVRLSDPNGMDPPETPQGEYHIDLANPLTDPLAQAAAFDFLLPGLIGFGLRHLDLGNRTTSPVGAGFLRLGEFAATGLLFYGPEVLSHEFGGHVGAADRFGLNGSLTSFGWFSGLASWSGSATPEQTLTISAAGVNQQALNAEATYSRIARTGFFNPQDAWAYFLGQAGTGAYALRTLTRNPPAPSDDINAVAAGPRSWSVGGIAAAGTLTALPSLLALGWMGWQFVVNNRRTLEVPSVRIGSARLAFPNFQTLLTSQGTVLGASTVLSLGRERPAFQLGVDIRPTRDFALDLSVRTHGLRIPGSPVEINPYLRFTAADPPGVFGGVEVGVHPTRWLGISGSIEGGTQNDLRRVTEGREAGVGGRASVLFNF